MLLISVFTIIGLLFSPDLCSGGFAAKVADVENQEYRVRLVGEEQQRIESQHQPQYVFNVYNKLTQQDSVVEMMNLTKIGRAHV